MKVEIRKVDGGETRLYEMEFPFCEFVWTEGNFSCDCNRALFFARANGEERLDDPDLACTTGKFQVRITDDGEVVLDEFEAKS